MMIMSAEDMDAFHGVGDVSYLFVVVCLDVALRGNSDIEWMFDRRNIKV